MMKEVKDWADESDTERINPSFEKRFRQDNKVQICENVQYQL